MYRQLWGRAVRITVQGMMLRFRISSAFFVIPLMLVGTWNGPAAYAGTGDLVGSLTFSADCPSGLGVGLTFDGTNLWYSCYVNPTDLYKANPTTGAVIASYNVLGGLGSLAYDSTRNKIWLAMGCAPGHAGSEVWLFDPGTGIATFQFNVPAYTGSCLVDGLGYDASNDTLYHSFDGATTIRHLSTTGVPQGDDNFPWGGSSCYNSGVAIGGNLLFQGSNGCSHVWVVDKVTKAASFNFSTVVPGDPNFRDESLTCDTHTFASLGKQVMWSKEAYSPMRAHAFEIPAGTCGVGGGPPNTVAIQFAQLYYFNGVPVLFVSATSTAAPGAELAVTVPNCLTNRPMNLEDGHYVFQEIVPECSNIALFAFFQSPVAVVTVTSNLGGSASAPIQFYPSFP